MRCCWSCSTFTTSLMLNLSLFVALAITVAHADYKTKPALMRGDAPYSHRRLFGIRRLKVVRPLTRPMSEVERLTEVRRHQSTDENPPKNINHVPRAQRPPKLPDVFEYPVTRPHKQEIKPSVTTTVIPTTTYTTPHDADYYEEKRKRIEARWRRLGINLDSIQYPIQKIIREKLSDFTKSPIRPMARPTSSHESIQSAEMTKQIDEFLPKRDDIQVEATQNTRKSMALAVEDKDIQQTTSRRPRIHGPLLEVEPIPTHEDAQKSGYGFGTGKQRSSAVVSLTSPVLQRFVSPFAKPTLIKDYHSRNTPVPKTYKFMQKLSQRPRLRIRRPGEKSISENSIQDDPNLTPFQNSAKARFGYGSRNRFTGGPVPFHRAIHSESLRGTAMTELPLTTTVATTIQQYTTMEPTTTETIIEDSGAGFGFGPSELPPELANVGFEIGGNGINFNVPGTVTERTPASEELRKRPKQRKQPNPKILKETEGLVIPQNSGLRPVSPPKEFLDGGGFGPGTRDDHEASPQEHATASGSALPDSGNEQDSGLFTGDSALIPSRGPTGDGYGPPIFPGGAVPPLVPAVGLGGAAAGKSPYGAMMEPTENPPTTVKPSALLNVLNKADQGFNQAITHFEQESPLETAAIDILEVALGSTKLDSQAKLLGHVDRTIGLDNLQRIQRWANTAGAMDVFKEQMVKFIKNIEPAENLLPTLPPQLDYLFKPSGR